MRTSEYVEICISIDNQNNQWNGKKGNESKAAERQKESKRVCVCVLIKTNNSVSKHPQRRQLEKHMGSNKWLSASMIN